MSLLVRVGCPECKGEGLTLCLACEGRGKRSVMASRGRAMLEGDQVTIPCQGEDVCWRCKGAGYLDLDPEEHDIEGNPIHHFFQVFEVAELRFCECGLPESEHRMDTVMQKPKDPQPEHDWMLGFTGAKPCTGFKLERDCNPKGGAS
jgi:hypothetical protein